MVSAADKNAIKAGWAEAIKDKEGLGKDIFLTLFEKYPQHQDLFSKFKGKSRAELEKLPALADHGLLVVKGLDEAMHHLDNDGALEAALVQLGTDHKARNVTAAHFDDLNTVLPAVLERRLGKAFTEHKAAWAQLVKIVVSSIQKGRGA